MNHFREEVINELNDIYSKKNKDYGNSFDKMFEEFGSVSVAIRIADKSNRLNNLVKKDYNPAVIDESIEDTLKDLANYAIMSLTYLKINKKLKEQD